MNIAYHLTLSTGDSLLNIRFLLRHSTSQQKNARTFSFQTIRRGLVATLRAPMSLREEWQATLSTSSVTNQTSEGRLNYSTRPLKILVNTIDSLLLIKITLMSKLL